MARTQSDVARAKDDVAAAPAAGGHRRGRQGRAQPRRPRSWPSRNSALAAAAVGALAAREQLATQPGADRGHRVEQHPERAARRRARCARPTWRCSAPSCRRRSTATSPSAACSSASASQAGHAADVGDPARPGLGRRQLQGRPAAQPAHRPAGRRSPPTCTARRSNTTARSPAWAPAPARRSRCCRRRTPPATGSRWCSACRCASRSTPKELAEHPLRVGLSMDAKVDVQQAPTARCWPTPRAPARRSADRGVRRRPAPRPTPRCSRIIAANLGRPVARASPPRRAPQTPRRRRPSRGAGAGPRPSAATH